MGWRCESVGALMDSSGFATYESNPVIARDGSLVLPLATRNWRSQRSDDYIRTAFSEIKQYNLHTRPTDGRQKVDQLSSSRRISWLAHSVTSMRRGVRVLSYSVISVSTTVKKEQCGSLVVVPALKTVLVSFSYTSYTIGKYESVDPLLTPSAGRRRRVSW